MSNGARVRVSTWDTSLLVARARLFKVLFFQNLQAIYASVDKRCWILACIQNMRKKFEIR